MKTKRITLLIALFAIMTMLFVSCNSDVTSSSAVGKPDEELVYASFTDNSKALSFSYDVPAYGDLYWRYSAVKKDAYGTVGQTWNGTSGEAFLPVPTAATTPTKGLDGKVGPFSQGTWDFKLQAFRNCTLSDDTLVFSDMVFEGTATNVVLNKNQTNYIAVTVTPAGDTGKIKISDAYYEWASVATAGSAQVKLVVTLVGRPDGSSSEDPVTYTYSEELTKETSENKYKFNGVGGYIAIPVSTTEVTTAIPAGVYTATFKIVENTDTPTIDEFVLQTFSLKVYGGLETIVTGNLTEGLSYENYFSVPEQTIAFTTSNSAGAARFEVDKTPSTATGETIKTTVVFPDNTLTSNTQHTLSVDVTTIETAETQFVIVTEPEQSPEVAVAAIGLELSKTTVTKDESGAVTDTTTEKVSDFDEYVTITTYIQDGLTGKITVVYNDPNAGTSSAKSQPIAKDGATEETEGKSVASMYATDSEMGDKLGYSAESGKLRFKTNHFSDFYVKTDGLYVKNVSTGRYYPTLQSAVDAALEGQTLQLIQNISGISTVTVNETKDLTIDLNGKTIETALKQTARHYYAIDNYGKLKLLDSSSAGTGKVLARGIENLDEGIMIIDGGKYYNIDTNGGAAFWNKSDLTINNAKIFVEYVGSSSESYGPGAIYSGESSTLVINNAEITSSSQGCYAVITDGNTTINNATVNGAHGALAIDSGNAVINGGSFTATNNYGAWITNDGSDTHVTINGGSFSGKYGLFSSVDDGGQDESDIAILVNGGTFAGTTGGAAVINNQGTEHSFALVLKGGTYNTNPSAYVAPGYYAKENTPYAGWWTVDSIFDGSGTEDDPYIIDGIDGWMELVHMCENDSTFASTNGKYFKMTSDVDVSSKTERATVHYFAGHIDFSGYTLCGFNSNNTVPGDVGDDGIVAAFSIVRGDVSISNLVYEINTINNSQTVYNQLVGIAQSYADGVKLLFDSVTVNGLATGVSGNNHSPLFAYALYNTNLTISCKNCTNNATIIGSGFKSAFIGNLSYVKSGSLTFENCKNNGTIISTDGKPVALLISNAGDNSANTDGVSITVANCVNNGVISTSGVSNFGLLLGSNYSSLSKAANISVNGSNWGAYLVDMTLGGQLVGSVAFITTTTIETDNGCFVLPSNSNAKYYQLHFSFSASSHAGGNVGYVVEFGNKSQQFTGDLPNDVAVSSWVDDETKVGDVSEYNITGATSGVLYKDSQGNYVFNESGSRLRDKVSVSFIAYGENNQVLSIATYQY